jgi:hypothetical protein
MHDFLMIDMIDDPMSENADWDGRYVSISAFGSGRRSRA